MEDQELTDVLLMEYIKEMEVKLRDHIDTILHLLVAHVGETRDLYKAIEAQLIALRATVVRVGYRPNH